MAVANRFVDLHLHTTYSDGRLSPRGVVEAAAARGLAAIAITDHDVLDGLPEAMSAGHELGVEVVSGIELTVDWGGRTVHLLGYFVDPEHEPLRRALERARRLMTEHVDAMLERLAAVGEGIERSALEKYRSRYPGGAGLVFALLEHGTLRRISGARDLLRMVSQEPRAFEAWEGIDLIHRAGGLAALAHPVRIKREKPLLEARDLAPLVETGLDAIEAWQVVQAPQAREHYQRLAEALGVLTTGGSDCHGPTRRGMRLGTQHVPAAVLSRLREARTEAGRDRS